MAASFQKTPDKRKTKRKGHNPDAYPEEFEEFRSMDLRMKPQPFKSPVKKLRRKK